MNQPVWVPVRGWEGLYEVNDEGQVRSLPRTVRCQPGGRKWATKSMPGKLLRPDRYRGYLAVTLCKENIKTRVSVHRIVILSFVGPCPVGMECRHLDGDKHNNRLSNLKWGTRRENMNDQRTHGTLAMGEKNYKAKLTEGQVKEIRRMHRTGKYRLVDYEELFGIDLTTAHSIIKRRTWKHVN